MLDAARLLSSLPLPSIFFVLFAGSARALGALFGLWGLYFVLGPAAVLRIGMAVTLSLPVMAVSAEQFMDLTDRLPRVLLMTMPVREFLIGFAIGLLASLPFFAIMGAGIVIDQYRGDFSPGLAAPENQQVGSFANLSVVMALFLFVEAGGFALLVRLLYQSFALFPPDAIGLGLHTDFLLLLGQLLQETFWLLLVVAMPLLVIFFLIDFALNMIFRLAGQIKMPSIEFLMKALVFVLAMPFLVIGMARLFEGVLANAPDPILLLQEFAK